MTKLDKRIRDTIDRMDALTERITDVLARAELIQIDELERRVTTLEKQIGGGRLH